MLIGEGRGYRNRRNNQRLVQPPDRVLVPTQRNMDNDVFEPPPRWRMVTSDRTQDSWSTALLPHHQPIKKGHKPCNPHPKCCLRFLGTRDDHPVRSPVWPLSISSLRGANSFKLNCCYYKGGKLVSDVEHPNLDQVERDFCSARQAYAHAQQEEVTEEKDHCPNSQEVS